MLASEARESARLWLRALRALPPGHRTYELLTIGFLILGLALRIHGYLFDPPSFWLDECSWAIMLIEQPISEILHRPIGFILVSKALAAVLGPTEPVLRAMPWLAGMGSVLLAPRLAERLFKAPAARLLFVALIALHPCAIDFSKEFKPYSVSLFEHLLLMHRVLVYIESGKRRDLLLALGLAVIGQLFAQDLLFAYPGAFLLMGVAALRKDRRQLLPIGAGAIVIIALLLGQYALIWSQMPAHEAQFWGDKYDVFHTSTLSLDYWEWWLTHYRDMVEFAGFRRRLWNATWLSPDALASARVADTRLWLGLHVAGVAALAFRRDYRNALLFLTPLAVLWLFNALEFWPAGAFRANLFVLAYAAAIACMPFALTRATVPTFRSCVPALVLILLPMLLFDRSWSARKAALTYHADFPRVLKAAIRRERSRGQSAAPLILDRRSCDPFRFYTRYHPGTADVLRPQISRYFRPRCVAEDGQLGRVIRGVMPHPPGWTWLVLHDSSMLDLMERGGALPGVEVMTAMHIAGHLLVGLQWKVEPAQPAPGRPPSEPPPRRSGP